MREISHAMIKFRNGTELFINQYDVIKYCDPQAVNTLDIENCLIRFGLSRTTQYNDNNDNNYDDDNLEYYQDNY